MPDPSFFTLEYLEELGVICEAIEVADSGRLYAFDQEDCSCYDPGELDGCNEAKALVALVQSGYCTTELADAGFSLFGYETCNQWTEDNFVALSLACSNFDYYDDNGDNKGPFTFENDGTTCVCKPPEIDPPCTEAKAVCDFVGGIGQAAWDESLQNYIPYMTCEELTPYDPVCSYFNENVVGGFPLDFDQPTCSC